MAGSSSTCILTTEEVTYCWGRSFSEGFGVYQVQPTILDTGLRFRELSLAANTFGNSICGITAESLLYCWGTLLTGYDMGMVIGTAPQLIGSDLHLASIRSASRHFCGLTEAGVAQCAGDYAAGVRGTGQASDGLADPDLFPNPVAGGLTFTQLALGLGNSCGLDDAGSAYCWGSEVALGNADAPLAPLEECGYTIPPFVEGGCSPVPVPVAGGQSFTSITAGQNHVCGLTTGGQVYCWGPNESGQLGVSGTEYSRAPVLAVLPQPALQVSAGSGFTCVILADRKAYCWGENHVGQTGTGTALEIVPQPTPVADGLVFKSISAGESHVCALRESGEVYCWGSNFQGELGTGNLTNSSVPIRVQF